MVRTTSSCIKLYLVQEIPVPNLVVPPNFYQIYFTIVKIEILNYFDSVPDMSRREADKEHAFVCVVEISLKPLRP